MKKLVSLIILFLIFIVSCASITLTEGGQNVKYTLKKEPESGYQEIGKVTVGQHVWEGAPDEEQAVIMIRNKTAEMGGNLVIIDAIEQKNAPEGGVYFSASGKAYKNIQ